MQIASLYPGFFANSAIGYCMLSIIETMESEAIKGSIMATASDKRFNNQFYQDAIPSFLNPIIYRLFSEKVLDKITEQRFFSILNSKGFDSKDFVYFWTQRVSFELYKKVREKGLRIIFEMVNTTDVYRKEILDTEYLRLGLPPAHGMTVEAIETEKRKLELTDFIYACSPEVEKSLKFANVPDEKILQTSYGLRERDILPISDIENRKNHQEFTVIFVGSIGVRKGPHLLLDYWDRAKVKGKLKLVGNIEEEVKPLIEPYLKRKDIEHVPFVNDLRDVYREADLFALPSLEEGSPLVTYLALGAGLPSIVSPMGGGGLVDDNNGITLDPHDDVAWIEALQKLSEDFQLREKFSMHAYEKAPNYLWSEVGRKRAEILLSRLKK